MFTIPYRHHGISYTKTTNYSEFTTILTNSGCTVTDIGNDTAGNIVKALSIGSLTSKPVIMIVGGIHGDHEWRSPHWIIEFMKIISTQPLPYSSWISQLKAKFDFYAIPLVMPFGYFNNSYVNANGVNINRNFDYKWTEFDDSQSSQKKGTSAFSELETKIVRDKVLQYKPVLFIDCHTWGVVSPGAVIGKGSHVTPMQFRIMQQCRSLIGRTDINIEDLADRPTADNWVRNQMSRLGAPIQSFYLEPCYLETDQEQSRIGINVLLQFMAWIQQWVVKKKLR